MLFDRLQLYATRLSKASYTRPEGPRFFLIQHTARRAENFLGTTHGPKGREFFWVQHTARRAENFFWVQHTARRAENFFGYNTRPEGPRIFFGYRYNTRPEGPRKFWEIASQNGHLHPKIDVKLGCILKKAWDANEGLRIVHRTSSDRLF